jgi:hypothetical protein
MHDSPFMAEASRIVDVDGSFALLVVINETFGLGPDGHVAVADQQQVIHASDQWLGTPGNSSLLHEADGAYYKPKTDILANGHGSAWTSVPLWHYTVRHDAISAQEMRDLVRKFAPPRFRYSETTAGYHVLDNLF